MVFIVGNYIYAIITIFNNVMAFVRVDPCTSKDLVPDGLVGYTDSEGPEAIGMEIEG